MVRTSVRALPVLVVVAVLAGCGGSDSPSSSATSAPDGMVAEPRSPGVDGEIVAVSDGLMQVQGSGSQTSVTWDDTTAITAQTAATLADVTVGACVVAIAEEETATTVQISTPADDGTCTGGDRPGMPTDVPDDWSTDGPRPSGDPGGRPTDMPSGVPTDMPSGGMPTDMPSGMAPGQWGGTSGQVTEVTDTTITVQADDDTTTVTVGSETTYLLRVESDASALVVGQCVSAQGEQDSAGSLAATSIEVSAPTDDGCSAAGRGPGGSGRPGAPGAGGGTSNDG